MHRPRKDHEDGFTLIELVFVVVIIGILTAVAFPSYGAIQGQAKVNAVKEANQNALTEYRAADAQGKLVVGAKIDYYDYHKEGDSIWSRVTVYRTVGWLQASVNQPGYTDGFGQYADGATCVTSYMNPNTDAEVRRQGGDPVCKYIDGDFGDVTIK